jgi:putative chitinase
MIDRSAFFDHARRTLFDSRLSARQRQGLELIIDSGVHRLGGGSRQALAYVLATAYHETGAAMQPIREKGGRAYLTRSYDILGDKPTRARTNGNTAPGDGIRYAGRGFVQLTWKNNYRRIGDLLGIDLVGSPDKALEPAIAALILVRGMQEGWFTGRKLADYFTEEESDRVQARRIINGLDRANLIAEHAQKFEAALQAEGSPVRPSPPPPPRASAPQPPPANR